MNEIPPPEQPIVPQIIEVVEAAPELLPSQDLFSTEDTELTRGIPIPLISTEYNPELHEAIAITPFNELDFRSKCTALILYTHYIEVCEQNQSINTNTLDNIPLLIQDREEDVSGFEIEQYVRSIPVTFQMVIDENGATIMETLTDGSLLTDDHLLAYIADNSLSEIVEEDYSIATRLIISAVSHCSRGYDESIEHEASSEDWIKFGELIGFLIELIHETGGIFLDAKKLAALVAEFLTIGPASAIALYLIKRIRNWSNKKSNSYGSYVANQMDKLQVYFNKTPRSRLSEIVAGTKIPRKEVKALLSIGPYRAEKGVWLSIEKDLTD